MTTPDSRQPASRKIARTALAIINTILPMSAVIFERKQARYWQALPVRSMAGILIALFFTVGAWGFFLDLMEWKRLPLWGLLISASLFGATGAVSFMIVRRRVFKLIPVLVILGVAAGTVPDWLPRGAHILLSDAAHQRIALDAICIMSATMLGYWSFLLFINTQGLEQVRTRTELDLAYSMQQMLVPPITYRTDSFEAYGLSLPSDEVGGDLVDLIPTEAGWIACLADVSGMAYRRAF